MNAMINSRTASPIAGEREITWVLGYGNPLRGDDGVGPLVAETVSSWNLPGVHAVALHQLVPEWAETLAQARRVVFIDASIEPLPRIQVRLDEAETEASILVSFQPIAPAAMPDSRSPTSSSPSTHHLTPPTLLALVRLFGDQLPDAWLMTVRGQEFDWGETLSPTAWRGFEHAIKILRDWLDVSPPPSETQGTPCRDATSQAHSETDSKESD